MSIRPAVAQHAVPSLATSDFRNPAATTRAVSFLLSLQPEGTYILTTPGIDDIVHMDVAHAALALAKSGHVAEARSALGWLLARMTTESSPDRYESISGGEPGSSQIVDYAGSWWDHFQSNGEPRRDLTRGRAEGVGLALIAVYAVYQDDPAYLSQLVGTSANAGTVADRVALAARYLSSSAIQHPDGHFNHRPDYTVSFTEEGARMVLGLRVASEMLDSVGRTDEAAKAADAADRGYAVLLDGDGLSRGMAYDYYALGIWGLATPAEASAEIDAVSQASLTTRAGVRNWDWQITTAPSLLDRLRFWGQSLAVAPSESFDYAIAAMSAGDEGDALDVEQTWLRLQRADGGFPAAYLPALGISFGTPTSYSAARFIMLERVLTATIGRR